MDQLRPPNGLLLALEIRLAMRQMTESMKPVKNSPELQSLASLLEQYDEILKSHAQAKVISLNERRKILQEQKYYLSKFIELSKKAIGRN